LRLITYPFFECENSGIFGHPERPAIKKTHKYLYGAGAFRMTEDGEQRPDFDAKENPELNSRPYKELERALEKMEPKQQISYLKKRLTNHICSVYIENHPELGLVADEDPRMVSELQRRIHRIQKLLEDSPLYSPFLRGINTDKYNEAGWSRRQKFANPFIHDIKSLARKVDNRTSDTMPNLSEMKVSDMIYENENKKKSNLVPEVYILRGLHYLLKIQKVESLRFASDKDLSRLRANHGNYRYALRHVSNGIYNGGFSLFNIVTFGSIFDKYIQNYRTWVGLEMSAIQFSGRLEVDQLRSKVNRHVTTLKHIRKNNKNIPVLRRMYPWFPDDYRYVRLKISDIKAAVNNHENKHVNKKVHGIITRQMIALFINLATFMAGSPLMRLGIILSRELKSNNAEIKLQQRMIQATQMLNNYYRMLGLGIDSRKGLENSLKLLKGLVIYCTETIERFVEKKGGKLEKSFERDPYIRVYTAINAFIQAYPEDKSARKMLHSFQPHAERLLRSSVKSNQIKTANTIVHNIQVSIRRHEELEDERRN